MIHMTARQRCALACLRINHPRARVEVPYLKNRHTYAHAPRVRVNMVWSLYSRDVWLDPDGSLELGDVRMACPWKKVVA